MDEAPKGRINLLLVKPSKVQFGGERGDVHEDDLSSNFFDKP
jgi:hypothetical protein